APPWGGSGTASCCGPAARRQGAGEAPGRGRTLIRECCSSCLHTRTSAFIRITASIRSRSAALSHSWSPTDASSPAHRLSPCRSRACSSRVRSAASWQSCGKSYGLEIKRALSKDEILTLYLSLAPYGGNLEGVRAASLAYFGKEPRRLTLGEAAMLVALPQSPERRRPDRSSRAVREARDRVLERAAAAGIF